MYVFVCVRYHLIVIVNNYNDKITVRFAFTNDTYALRASYGVSFMSYAKKNWPW